jgi:hypothetical protein
MSYSIDISEFFQSNQIMLTCLARAKTTLAGFRLDMVYPAGLDEISGMMRV